VAILEILGLNRLKEFIPLSRIRGTFLGQWLKSYYGHFESQEKVRPVDFVTGACLMVRREILDDVGLLDENFFMYAEEIDWCYRMKLAGWKVYYYPEAKIIHYIAQSSAQVQNKAYLYRMFSIAAYFHKHGNMLCRAAIRTGMFIRASGGIIISLLTRPFRLFCPAGISKSSRVYYQLLILSLRSWAR
jgi:GT2 family glycosyltransferase